MSLQRCGFFGELLKNQQHAFFGEGQARGLLIARAYVCHFITSQKIEQNQKRMHRNASLLFSAALFFSVHPSFSGLVNCLKAKHLRQWQPHST